MRGGQPRTYGQAILRAALIVGAPLAVFTVLDAVSGDLSWTTALLRLALWLAVSALVALAFSGGVTPRRDREAGGD